MLISSSATASPVITGLMRSNMYERDGRRQQAAQKFHEARADQIPHALDVAHDARDERARFVRVVVRDRQAPDVLLHFSAQLGDHPLRRFR